MRSAQDDPPQRFAAPTWNATTWYSTKRTSTTMALRARLTMLQNAPGQKHTLTVEYAGAPGEYGPLDVRHTPMVRQTPVSIDAPGCAPTD